MMNFYRLSAAEAKKKYSILTDHDLKQLHKDADGLYMTNEVREKALKKALKNFNKEERQ